MTIEERIAELFLRYAAQRVLRNARLAKQLGMAPSDLECLDLLLLDGPLNPSAIAAGTGLTSGGVTTVIKRLERRGFVRRERDPADGRGIQVSVVETASQRSLRSGETIQRWKDLNSRFSDADLDVVARYFEAVLDEVSFLNREDQVADAPREPARRRVRAV